MIVIKKVIRKFNIASNQANNYGMTMMEVLMGFTILMVLMGALSGIISFSTNMYMNSVDMKRAQEKIQAEIYKKDNAGKKSAKPLKFTCHLSGIPGQEEIIDTEMYVYAVFSGDIIEAEAENKIEMNYYYIGTEFGGGTP